MRPFHTLIALASLATLTASLGVASEREGNKLPDAAKSILDKSTQFELIALDPDPKKEGDANGYFGWKVIGKTVVKDEKARKTALESLYKGIADGKDGAKCFEPRHGIRATYDGKSVDLVICFACSWIHVYVNGERVGTLVTAGSPEGPLDRILEDAGIGSP